MAGFFFYAAFIFSGENIYGEYPLFVVFLTLICHGILYFCGLVMFLNREFSDCDLIKLYIGNFFVLLWALLMRPFTAPDSRLFIYEFLEGKFIKLILPENYFRFAIPVYYVLIFLFIISSVILFFRINRRFHKSEL
jgi:hypothetical protein